MRLSLRPLRVGVLLVAGLLAGGFKVVAQAPTKQWDKTFGGVASENLKALQQTADGGYILGGISYSGLSGDKTQASKGGADYWIVKIDGNGIKQWDKSFGGSGDDALGSLLQTADGGYLLAGSSASGVSGDKTQPNQGTGPISSSDYWLVKLDAQGTKQWDKTFGGNGNESIAAVRPTTDGGYILGGTSSSGLSGDKTQAGPGGEDYWVLKLDAAGAKQWDKTVGGTTSDLLKDLQQTSDGGYMLGGYSASGVGGDKSQPNRGTGITPTYDYWVLKLDAQGAKQWDKTVGGNDHDYLLALQQTADSGYLLAGYSGSGVSGDKTSANWGATGTRNYWAVKLDATGAKQWDKAVGGTMGESLATVHQTADGGYVLGGWSFSGVGGDKTQPSQGAADFWLVKLGATGIPQWNARFGGSQYEYLWAVQPTNDGGYILGGYSNSGADGDKSQPSQGDSDYWVVKLGPAGTLATTPAAAMQALHVYPNPALTSITIRLADNAPRTGLQVSLRDATGRLVLHQALPATAGAEVPVRVGQRPAGLYLLQVQGPNGYLATQRLQLQ